MGHPISVEYLRWIVLLPLFGAVVNGLPGILIQRRAPRYFWPNRMTAIRDAKAAKYIQWICSSRA